ncbi:MAG: 3-oxoacyl-ACP reductase FabG [Gammaproteobacteria bacterium]|nr:3-oxoacyl-ACP reductase FabG [Gammaproteobacteria bacterium]
MNEAQRLKKVAVVTGGSRGIGRACVRALAEAGYRLAYSYVQDEAAAQALSAELESQGREHLALRCDIADPDQVAAFFGQVEARFGRLDVLVNNAGIIRDGLLANMAYADLAQVIQTNLVGPMLCCQGAIPAMMRQRNGCIVNLSSVAAQKPGKGQSNYAAAKGGVEALTRALAVELAPRNIRVNAIAPGIVNTGMSAALVDAQAPEILSRLLVKRHAEPEEIAEAVLFLAERAPYMSGEVLALNGGLKMP